MSHEKLKPKTVKSKIPVHCAHTGLINPWDIKPNPLNPERDGPRKLALYAKIIREGGSRLPPYGISEAGLVPNEKFALTE
jgi:hypothetical protein